MNNRLCHVVLALLLALIGWSCSSQADTTVRKAGTDRVIVFVHGFLGDERATFTNGSTKNYWPDLMAADQELVRYDIISIGYNAGANSPFTIEEIATTISQKLTDGHIFEYYDQIVFVTHSMGGLVAKRVLLNLWALRSNILEQIAGVIFLSTPAKGAAAAGYADMLRRLARERGLRPMGDLRAIDDNGYLQLLDNEWRGLRDQRRPEHVPRLSCAYEKLPTLGMVVVPLAYAETDCDNNPYPFDLDHLEIVKPPSNPSPVYDWVKARILESSAALSSVPLKRHENATTIGALVAILLSQPAALGERVELSGAEQDRAKLENLRIPGSYFGATWADLFEKVAEKHRCISVVTNRNRRAIAVSLNSEPKSCGRDRLVCPTEAC